ncbi:DUF5689 domain-containing protein [Proteiniphilum sp. UBA5384]|uniref:DUF5689 domain-containing protein n=1 Tax=Proteiniphilum sp. UBA5384 TaxID=1947279 RepID=UPI0025CB9057|nr:DUF5689 domain-containing protein [Proteiniphilum sp. UBA5384]
MKRADKLFAHRMARRFLGLVVAMTVLLSCERDFQAPPLTEPAYTGPEANMTIAKLKSLYATITDPTLIDVDYTIKATVVGNDVSGNIFKQLYIQDETGGINMGVDQNSIFTEFREGQEIYVQLKGLYMVMYGEQLQIGYGQTNANRIPWEIFNFYVQKNKWPKAENAVPRTVKLSELDETMVNTLVKLENVYFVDGGKLPFSASDATTNRLLKDGDGNSIIVRNSNYASFAADMLPEGGGTLVAVLSKFRADWQLLIRSIDDCRNFGQPIPGGTTPVDPDIKTYYTETFGTADVAARPLIADYTGFDNKSVKYSDASGSVSVRTTNTFNTPHLWFPSGKDGYLTIEGIDTSEGTGETLTLNYELTANLFDAGSEMNLNAMAVTVDGKAMDVPSQVVSNANGDNNKVYSISLKGIPAKKDLKIEFHGKAADNTMGLRLDNISITTAKDEVIVIKPK